MTLDKIGEEVKWLCSFLEDITCWAKLMSKISMYNDNESTTGRV